MAAVGGQVMQAHVYEQYEYTGCNRTPYRLITDRTAILHCTCMLTYLLADNTGAFVSNLRRLLNAVHVLHLLTYTDTFKNK